MSRASLLQFISEVIQQEASKITEPKRSGLSVDQLGLQPRGGVHNIVTVYNQATPEEKQYWGKWYHNAKEDVQNLADRFSLPFPVAAAIVAVLSPGNKWGMNLLAAQKVLQGDKKINAYPRQVLKALKILETGDVGLVTGPKVTVFFNSLMNPKLVEKDMVLDGHAINIWRGEKAALKNLKYPSVKERAQMIQDYQTAAEQLGVPVQAVQAVTWYIWKYTGKTPPLEAPTGVYDVSKFRNAQPANDVSLDEINAVGAGGIVGAGMGNGGTDVSKRLLWSGDDVLKETNTKGKKILLLVHPDIVFEMGRENLQTYYKKIEDNVSYFDYIITHLFYSPTFSPSWLSDDEVHNHIFENFLKMIKKYSNVVKWDQPKYQASFDKELPYYLIDNPNSTLYFAGGYKDLCVKMTQDAAKDKLGYVIRETNTSISCYEPLIVNGRYSKIL